MTAIKKKNETEIKKAIDCLNIFSILSGLCLNINKCVLFPLKICNYNNILGIPVKEMVDYLGIKICKVQKEINNLNFTPIIKKIKQNLIHV